jgi:bacillolysin
MTVFRKGRSMLKLPFFLLLIFLAAVLVSSTNALAFSSEAKKAVLLSRINSLSGGEAVIEYHEETGMVRFIGAPPGRALHTSKALLKEISPEQVTERIAVQVAGQFLQEYGLLFGLKQPEKDLSLIKTSSGETGQIYARYQQIHQGIPVLGGELIVSLSQDQTVTGAIGEALPNLDLDPTPKIMPEQAVQAALESVVKGYGMGVEDLVASEPDLWIYNPALLGGPGPRVDSLVWRVEVTPREVHPLRELVLVDARAGIILLQFNQSDTIQRMVHDLENVPGNLLPGKLVRPEGSPASGISDADIAYENIGDAYRYFFQHYGRDSINNLGLPIVASVRYCPSSGCGWMNAFWNGQQMVFTPGVSAADDVVAHELVHGITQYEANLFYYMQSGAINEAFSDIFGEFIDLTNGRGNDSESVRWLMGEDLPGGAIRSLKNPALFGHPDRMTSPNYYCGTDDNGGVHRNSGVANKAAHLMVDGGYFNGITVTGIGIQKTSAIWYETLTNLLTSGAGYNDLYNGLQQSCSILNGTSNQGWGAPVPPPTGPYLLYAPQVMNHYHTNFIILSDCQQVKKALDAVEMYRQPPSCGVAQISPCPVGYQVDDLFFDDMESPAQANWASGALQGANSWFYPQYPNPTGFNATYTTSGIFNLWGYNLGSVADYFIAMTKDVHLPPVGTPYLHFNHAYEFEGWGFDGGVLEFKRGGDPNWYDAGLYFPTQNGYNGNITVGWKNPLGGREAFIGYSRGYTSSRLDLSHARGDAIRFRFRIGTDDSASARGWFIDDFRIYTCSAVPAPTTPTPTRTITPTLPIPTPTAPTPSPDP